MATKMVDGQVVEMTPEEEAQIAASRVPTLEQAKASKRTAIVGEWERREAKGYVIDVPGNLNSYFALTIANARSLKAAVDSATTVADVQAIDEKAGWP